MNEPQDPILVALYARVSSERQDVGISVSAQLRVLSDYARKNGYAVAREYVDEAERVAASPPGRSSEGRSRRPDVPTLPSVSFSRLDRSRQP